MFIKSCDQRLVTIVSQVQTSFTKLIVSHDLPRSTVTNQIVFFQRNLQLAPEFERAMDCRWQALVAKLETSDTTTFI